MVLDLTAVLSQVHHERNATAEEPIYTFDLRGDAYTCVMLASSRSGGRMRVTISHLHITQGLVALTIVILVQYGALAQPVKLANQPVTSTSGVAESELAPSVTSSASPSAPASAQPSSPAISSTTEGASAAPSTSSTDAATRTGNNWKVTGPGGTSMEMAGYSPWWLTLPVGLLIAYLLLTHFVLRKRAEPESSVSAITSWVPTALVVCVAVALVFLVVRGIDTPTQHAQSTHSSDGSPSAEDFARLVASVEALSSEQASWRSERKFEQKSAAATHLSNWSSGSTFANSGVRGVSLDDDSATQPGKRLVDALLAWANPIVDLIYVLLVLMLLERVASLFQWLRSIFATPNPPDRNG